IDAEDEPRRAALELDGLLARGRDLLVGLEPAQHPADRRLALRGGARLDGPGDDQAVDRPRHRDVVEPQPLGPLLLPALLAHGLELARAELLLLADEADEALDVRPAQLLVRAGEPHQLAQVRVAALPVPAGEDGEVVVVLGDDLLAEALEREARGRGGEA